MSSINKKTTTIGGRSKIKPKRIASVAKIPQSNDDVVLAKSSKLTYYILGGFTIISVIVVGVLLFKYFESSKQPLKLEQEVVKVEASNDENVLMDEGDTQPKSINLEPKTKDEQYSLGVRYIQGNGVDKNYTEAIKWFTLAATQEHSDSQLMLGKIYYYGEFVKPDFKKALMWSTLAAAQGLSEAQYLLGLMYENGSGVTESKVEAKKWYTLAANQGMSEAKEKLLTVQSSHNYKSFTPAMTPKLVTHEDLNQVDKYLSNIKRNQSKTNTSRDANNREIIWN
jgi:hypothetical protein